MKIKNKFSNLDLAYFAGLIDSDGCISLIRANRLTKNNKHFYAYTPWIQIAQMDHQALDELAKKFDVNSYCEMTRHNKVFKRVILTGKKCYKFLKQIHKYLRIKQKQASIILKFEEVVKQKYNLSKRIYNMKREKLVNEIRKLNGRHRIRT